MAIKGIWSYSIKECYYREGLPARKAVDAKPEEADLCKKIGEQSILKI